MASRTQLLKDHWKEQRLFLSRVIGAAVMVLLVTGVLVGRLVWLQVIKHDDFETQLQKNLVRIQALAPTRGLIYDRRGNILAENVPTMQLVAIPEFVVDDVDTLLLALEELELLDPGKHEALSDGIRLSTRRWEPVLLANLNERQTATFAAHGHQFRGIDIRAGLIRSYPFADAFAHVVGYVGSPSEDDYEKFGSDDYTGTSQVGKTGIERFYEQVLHGKAGFQQVVVDARGRPAILSQQATFLDSPKNPAPGEHVVLALDAKLQLAAVNAMKDMRGAVVAIDPRNGEVLTMVSAPSFDPNSFATGISQAEYLELSTNPGKPFINRVLAKQYNPGSTVKPFFGLAGLHYETDYINEEHFCNGEYQLPGNQHVYREGSNVLPHGETDLHSAIVRSCNVYFYGLAHALEIDRMEEFMKRFGFGARSGIDLSGEYRGLMPGKEWKSEEFSSRDDKRWYPGETVITGIGQGFIEVTPLQLAHATATLAVSGHRFGPHLLIRTKDAKTGGAVDAQIAELDAVDDVDPLHWAEIQTALNDVTSMVGGTGFRAMEGAPYSSAGKSGTAQVVGVGQDEEYDAEAIAETLRDNALFIAYAPAENPEIAIAVVVENVASGGGGGNAGPIARKVLDAYFGTGETVEHVARLIAF